LQATGRVVSGAVELCIESQRFAQFVSVDVPGHVTDTNWFHLAPGDRRTVRAHRRSCTSADGGAVRAQVRALNMSEPRSLKCVEEQHR
jgi:hypothetical protein